MGRRHPSPELGEVRIAFGPIQGNTPSAVGFRRPWPARILVLVCLMLAGCATLTTRLSETPRTDQEAPRPPLSPLLAFMAEAEPGQAADISDPQTGSSVRVVAGRRYFAASGKTCRRFRVLSPGRYEGLSEGLACRAPSGQWTVSALILNPSDLGTRP